MGIPTRRTAPSTAWAERWCFEGNARADAATLVAQSGEIIFDDGSDGGTARVILTNPGGLVLQSGNKGGAPETIGSIEGSGPVVLGLPLFVGSNGRSTTYAGHISRQHLGDTLTKLGAGTLTLSSPQNDISGIMVDEGGLVVNNAQRSGTGAGPVLVDGGSLGGRGTIAGAVQIGTSSGPASTLAPALGSKKPRNLTLQADGAYHCLLATTSGGTPGSDEVAANGVTIAKGAKFKLTVTGPGGLTQGESFTVLNNTASTPISGTFANLPDGGVISAGGYNFQSSYEGGDGNDLTLTVVP